MGWGVWRTKKKKKERGKKRKSLSLRALIAGGGHSPREG